MLMQFFTMIYLHDVKSFNNGKGFDSRTAGTRVHHHTPAISTDSQHSCNWARRHVRWGLHAGGGVNVHTDKLADFAPSPQAPDGADESERGSVHSQHLEGHSMRSDIVM
jgi:hypothetical protein